MTYAIGDFWKARLSGLSQIKVLKPLQGWSIEGQQNPAFVEPTLAPTKGFENLTAPVWLVAAPGAVGKSTLAKEISSATGAVYLDLASADTVAGNYITGGLVKTGLYPFWLAGSVTLLVDALDEAHLRVTQQSFDDFLGDIRSLAEGRSVPIVLFGRVRIVEEAWEVLASLGLDCPIFSINFFDAQQSTRFISSALDKYSEEMDKYPGLRNSLAQHRSVYVEAAQQFVTGLIDVAGPDGSRFSGYAPVLEAIARLLAEEPNPYRLRSMVEETIKDQILTGLTTRILMREAAKLTGQLISIPSELRFKLYTPPEQLSRLAGVIMECSPDVDVALDPQYAASYDAAMKRLLIQHPFLAGNGRDASGSVFEAAICAHALHSNAPDMRRSAERYVASARHAPNPFLLDFYVQNPTSEDAAAAVPPEHLVSLYESRCARLAVGEYARLIVEASDDDESAEAEIHVSNPAREVEIIPLLTHQAGQLRFGRSVSGVSVDAPSLDVVIGNGRPVEMIAPVQLNVAKVTFDCPELTVGLGDIKGRPLSKTPDDDTSVMIEANVKANTVVPIVPRVRPGAEFLVSWPEVKSYPWAPFATEGSDASDSTDLREALQLFRRLVIAFRSHSKGRLARYKYKIEHVRMTKGKVGNALRQRMLIDRILSLEEKMYFLDPDALGRITGANYLDVKHRKYNERLRSYLRTVATGN